MVRYGEKMKDGKMQKELIHEILKNKVGYVFNLKDCAEIEDLILGLWFMLENEIKKGDSNE